MASVRCSRCGRRVPKASPDPDFCQGCIDRIDYVVNSRMELARANGCLLDGVFRNDSRPRRQAVMAAFLDMFHPEMNIQLAREIAQEVQ